MPLFMAGAITMGRGVASSVVEMRSSAIPLAILAMILAVAGATITRSGSCASEMWWMGSEGSSKRPTATGSLGERAERERPHKLRGMLAHNDLDARAALLQQAHDIARLIGGDPAGNAQQDRFSLKLH